MMNNSSKKNKRPASSSVYKRYCDKCGTYLQYRNIPFADLSTKESYCSNNGCPEYDQRVETVHVS